MYLGTYYTRAVLVREAEGILVLSFFYFVLFIDTCSYIWGNVGWTKEGSNTGLFKIMLTLMDV